jgi:hypothetical protein
VKSSSMAVSIAMKAATAAPMETAAPKALVLRGNRGCAGCDECGQDE